MNFPHAWCLNYKSWVANPRMICNLGTTSVDNFPHAWCPNCKSRVAKPRVICNLGTTSPHKLSTRVVPRHHKFGKFITPDPATRKYHYYYQSSHFILSKLVVPLITNINIWLNNPYFQESKFGSRLVTSSANGLKSQPTRATSTLLFVREHGVHAGPKDYFVVVVVVVVVICGSI
jgi:hypothetical protein